MKIPVDRIDLSKLGYDDYWIDVPKSVKEGFIHNFSKTPVLAEDETDADATRETNIRILEVILAWNIDDDAGNVLPTIAKCKTKAEKQRVIAEIPVDIIMHVAQRIAGNVQVPEATKDF